MRLFVFFLSCYLPVFQLAGQSGCTDPQASNYNLIATVNDGSCTYPDTYLAPTVRTGLPDLLKENSGLILTGGSLWSHGDGGSGPFLYEIDSVSGSILRTVTIGGVSNLDWEDIAFDGQHLYIGDFGNNANGNRTDLRIYKFPLTAIPAGTDVLVPASSVEWIDFAYEDQSDFSPQGTNHTQFDCEAMIWYDDSLHLFTKDWIGYQTVRYTVPAKEGMFLARRRETLPVDALITGADITDKGVLALLGYRDDDGVLSMWLLSDYRDGWFFNGNKRKIGLGLAPFSGQLEGICFRDSGSGYLSNEELTISVLGNPITIPARLYSIEIAQWLQPQFLRAHNLDWNGLPVCRFVPNPVKPGQTITSETSWPGDSRLILVDSAGQRIVWEQQLANAIAMPDVAAGSYFLAVFSNGQAPACVDKILVR
ncbi:MAG: T9SS C-terminal target domain-containing protein [Bacteroidetes bacterium]|nr:MAG: T9SS C-terminal target domain-containing protein [Bacteroidota bacterium]